MQQLSYNGSIGQKLSVFQQYALALTQKYEPERAAELMSSITGDQSIKVRAKARTKLSCGEDSRVTAARERAQRASQPGG
jgi:hypothetical protein